MERVKAIMKRIGALFLAAALTISILPGIEMKNVKGENFTEMFEMDEVSDSNISENFYPKSEETVLDASGCLLEENDLPSQLYSEEQTDENSITVTYGLTYITKSAYGKEDITYREVTEKIDKDTTISELLSGISYGKGEASHEIIGWRTEYDLSDTVESIIDESFTVEAEYDLIPIKIYWFWVDEIEKKSSEQIVWADSSWTEDEFIDSLIPPSESATWEWRWDGDICPYGSYWVCQSSQEEFPVLIEYYYWDDEAYGCYKYEIVQAHEGETVGEVLSRVDGFVPPCAEEYGFIEWSYNADERVSHGSKIRIKPRYLKDNINVYLYVGTQMTLKHIVALETDSMKEALAQLEPAKSLEGATFVKWAYEGTEWTGLTEESTIAECSDFGWLDVMPEYDTPIAEIYLYYLDSEGGRVEDKIIARLSPDMTYNDIKDLVPCPNSADANYEFLGWEYINADAWLGEERVSAYRTVSLKAKYEVENLYVRQYYYAKDTDGTVTRKNLDTQVVVPVGMDYSKVTDYLCEVDDCCFTITGWRDTRGSYCPEWKSDRNYVEFEAVYKTFPMEVTRFYMNNRFETKRVNQIVSVTADMTYNQVIQMVDLPDDAMVSIGDTSLFSCPNGLVEDISLNLDYSVKVVGEEIIYGRKYLACVEHYPEKEFFFKIVEFFEEETHEYKKVIDGNYRGFTYSPPDESFEGILAKYGYRAWSEMKMRDCLYLDYLGIYDDIFVCLIRGRYDTAKLVYHYLDGTTETIFVNDDIMKYKETYRSYYYEYIKGVKWSYCSFYDNYNFIGGEKIDIGPGGLFDIYECPEENTRVVDLTQNEHTWDLGKKYYNEKEAGTEYTCTECGEKKYVRDESFSSLAQASNGNWYDYVNGLVSTYTGLRYYNGSWWYVEKGKVNFGATTLCQYGGSWWYVQKGKVNFGATTLCNYGGSWWYVEKGKVNFNATTLCQYGGTWWYVEKGKVNFGATTLCQYGGTWWYVQKGKVNFGATTLCQYGGTWWYVEKGKVDFNATTLCQYGGTWWYVQKGKVNFGATTLCQYGGTWWYVEKGKVNFNATTLCNYGGKWWYVQKGKVNFGATTLCKYNGTWWYVEKGAVNFNYTGYFKYNGTNYRIVKGVVKF